MKILYCKFPGCNTILRHERFHTKFCSLHERILEQNHIEYDNKGFYVWTTITGKNKLKRKYLYLFQVKQLKEIADTEDFYACTHCTV